MTQEHVWALYKGVKPFKTEGWCAYTQIDGVQALLYTGDTAEECASAYDEYITLLKPKKWQSNLNKVTGKHCPLKLWSGLARLASPKVMRVASILEEHFFNQQGGNQ